MVDNQLMFSLTDIRKYLHELLIYEEVFHFRYN